MAAALFLAVYQGYGGAFAFEVQDCMACHGEHTIAKATDPRSKISPRNIPKTCAACHEEERLSVKYGLATKRYVTYIKSSHGLANKFGMTFIANCASCHGYHDILPESDPRSSINKANLAATCGKCHPGAGENFAKGRIHVEATKESSKGMYYVRQFYTWFIGILMSCFLIYTALDLNGRRRRRKNVGKGGLSSR